MAGPRQLKGNLKMAAAGVAVADVSAYVSSMVLNTGRASIGVPGTLLTAQSSTVAGETSQSLTVRFHSGIDVAGFWARLYAIITSPDATADWSANWEEGVTTVDNPRFFGSAATGNAAVLLSLDLGADIGALRQQTITLPLQGPASSAVS